MMFGKREREALEKSAELSLQTAQDVRQVQHNLNAIAQEARKIGLRVAILERSAQAKTQDVAEAPKTEPAMATDIVRLQELLRTAFERINELAGKIAAINQKTDDRQRVTDVLSAAVRDLEAPGAGPDAHQVLCTLLDVARWNRIPLERHHGSAHAADQCSPRMTAS